MNMSPEHHLLKHGEDSYTVVARYLNREAKGLQPYRELTLVTEYLEIFDYYGLDALAKYITEADHGPDIIKQTVFHDIFGRKDECFSPRSIGWYEWYLKTKKGEKENAS